MSGTGGLALCCSFALLLLAGRSAARNNTNPQYGLQSRPSASPFLGMPRNDAGPFPARLSQTGAFKNARELLPADALIPYDINVSFYSDGAAKQRWVSVPRQDSATASKVRFTATGDWQFPDGTVFVKHFEIATDETHPEIRRRLETRLLVRQANGGVYGVTYKWRPDNSDADLLATNLTERIEVHTATGVRTQTWYYPSRSDCRTCHSSNAGGVLGLKTRQMNRAVAYPGGVVDNQLRTWNHIGLFETALKESDIPLFSRLAPANDVSRSVEDRARSYLDVNCAYCHRPGGTVAYFDARYDTPLEKQGLINGQVLIDEGLDKARVIAPNDPWRSVALLRVSTLEGLRMPPLAHETLDQHGVELLRNWIASLPGPKVLPPPTFSSKGATEKRPFELRLAHPDSQAAIHYTLDGTAPTMEDLLYNGPINISESTTVRARAFRAGYTKSITVQETFVFPTAATKH
ncbi:MAG TPA: chitobiase/beta-hexosaminidase C-terminal domain-containing protein [Verrucomicrobiae bacterium]|nr:chitobiase/beta-hexosaminidase C-terminal domain-containing protein [Verrucomicrobiae bacterium]